MEQKNIITRTRVEYYVHYIGPLKAAGERITRQMSTWVAYSKKGRSETTVARCEDFLR